MYQRAISEARMSIIVRELAVLEVELDSVLYETLFLEALEYSSVCSASELSAYVREQWAVRQEANSWFNNLIIGKGV